MWTSSAGNRLKKRVRKATSLNDTRGANQGAKKRKGKSKEADWMSKFKFSAAEVPDPRIHHTQHLGEENVQGNIPQQPMADSYVFSSKHMRFSDDTCENSAFPKLQKHPRRTMLPPSSSSHFCEGMDWDDSRDLNLDFSRTCSFQPQEAPSQASTSEAILRVSGSNERKPREQYQFSNASSWSRDLAKLLPLKQVQLLTDRNSASSTLDNPQQPSDCTQNRDSLSSPPEVQHEPTVGRNCEKPDSREVTCDNMSEVDDLFEPSLREIGFAGTHAIQHSPKPHEQFFDTFTNDPSLGELATEERTVYDDQTKVLFFDNHEKLNAAPMKQVIFNEDQRQAEEKKKYTVSQGENATANDNSRPHLTRILAVLRSGESNIFEHLLDIYELVDACIADSDPMRFLGIEVLYCMANSSAINWSVDAVEYVLAQLKKHFPANRRLHAAYQNVLRSQSQRNQ